MTATDRVRVVLDANVFVSGAIRAGASARLVEQWLKSAAFDVVACPELIEEVRDVLTNRQRLRRWIDLDRAIDYVATIEATVTLFDDPFEVVEETRDPGDDYLIALALASSAMWIVTGDKDLLEWTGQHPPTLAPAAFEAWLKEQAHAV